MNDTHKLILNVDEIHCACIGLFPAALHMGLLETYRFSHTQRILTNYQHALVQCSPYLPLAPAESPCQVSESCNSACAPTFGSKASTYTRSSIGLSGLLMCKWI